MNKTNKIVFPFALSGIFSLIYLLKHKAFISDNPVDAVYGFIYHIIRVITGHFFFVWSIAVVICCLFIFLRHILSKSSNKNFLKLYYNLCYVIAAIGIGIDYGFFERLKIAFNCVDYKYFLHEIISDITRLVLLILIIITIIVLISIKRRNKSTEPEIVEPIKWKIKIDDRILKAIYYCVNIIGVLILVVFSLVLAYFSANNYISGRGRPNIFFIGIDTLRADHLGCYGYKRNTTPNIDKFASESTLYLNAYSPSSWTRQSTLSFLSSRYMHTTASSMAAITVPLAQQVFFDKGYTTTAIISNPLMGARFGFNVGYNNFIDKLPEKISSPSVYEKFEECINKLKKSFKPIYMFTFFLDPHSPYIYHKSFPFNASGEKYKDGEEIEITVGQLLTKVKASKGKIIDYYDSDIAFTDFYVGKVLDSLKKNGLYDNSIIIITADHGEELGDHMRIGHGHSLYNEVTNVPLIIKMPKQKTHKEIKGSFAIIDIFPSLLKAAGININRYGFQGRAYDLKNIRKMDEKYIYALTDFDASIESSMKNKVKYIKEYAKNNTKTITEFLYDLNTDHKELKDISKTDINKFKEMQYSIKGLDGLAVDENADVSSPKDIDEETKKAMKALGYIQ